MVNLEIKENDSGQRLDRFLRKYLKNASLAYIYKLIRSKVKVNGKKAEQNLFLKVGDTVTIYISQEEYEGFLDKKKVGLDRPVNYSFDKILEIIYEDENILVVNKPPGLLTHPTKEEKEKTITNQVLSYLIAAGDYKPDKEKVFIPAPANRLDRNTSGLVVFGKNAGALRALTKMFREQTSIDRYYIALVHGKVKESKILQGNDEKSGKYMETHIKVLQNEDKYSLVEAMLVTGRKHQIRIQLAKEGYPIVGDKKYGRKSATKGKYNLYLHGWKLVFNDCPPPLEYLNASEVKTELPFDTWLTQEKSK